MEEIIVEKGKENKLYLDSKPYVLEKNRLAGEADLEHLARTEHSEGCWIFDADNLLWYNATKLSSERDSKSGLKVTPWNFKLSGNLASIYHTHPEIIESSIKNKISATHIINPQQLNCIRFYVARPSPEDIYLFSILHNENKGTSLDFRVASAHGIITTKFHNTANAQSAKEMYNFVSSSKENAEAVYFAGNETFQAINKGIEHLNSRMRQMCTFYFKPSGHYSNF